MKRELDGVHGEQLQELQKKLDQHESRLIDLEKCSLQGSLSNCSQELAYKEPILKKADERLLPEVTSLRKNKQRIYIHAALIICIGFLLVGMYWFVIV